MNLRGKVVTKQDPLRLRSTPHRRSTKNILGLLPKGSLVDIDVVDGEWMKVYSPKLGITGWVWRDFIEELPPPQPDVMAAPMSSSIDPNGLCYWPWLGFAAMMSALMAGALLLYWPR